MKLPIDVRKQISRGASIFDNVSKNDSYKYVTCDINCAILPDPIWEKNKPLPTTINNILVQFPENNLPALYYFEIIGDLDKVNILKAYKEMKSNPQINRASSALKKSPPLDTIVLYAGKVKKNIQGRLKVHLGYYHNGDTSGLQLVCWAKNIELELRFHVFQFDEEMAPFIGSLELSFSNSLNPMIGKQ